MRKLALSRQTRLQIEFCDLCGARLFEANRNRRFKKRCVVCATSRGRRDAEVSLRRQTQVISGFKPSNFWKSQEN
jgi:hypothetical protein